MSLGQWLGQWAGQWFGLAGETDPNAAVAFSTIRVDATAAPTAIGWMQAAATITIDGAVNIGAEEPAVEEVRKTGGLRFRQIKDAVARVLGSKATAQAGSVTPEPTVSIDVQPFVISTRVAAARSGYVRVLDEWNADPIIIGARGKAASGKSIPQDSISTDAKVRGSFAKILNGTVEPALDVDVHVRAGRPVSFPRSFVKAKGVKNPTDEELIVLITAALRKR